MDDYPYEQPGSSVWDDYRRLADEEYDEHLRLKRAGELPTPRSSTGLCKACHADIALPAELLCAACKQEVFACEPCECGGVCDKCRQAA